jgi:hypothetical protein
MPAGSRRLPLNFADASSADRRPGIRHGDRKIPLSAVPDSGRDVICESKVAARIDCFQPSRLYSGPFSLSFFPNRAYCFGSTSALHKELRGVSPSFPCLPTDAYIHRLDFPFTFLKDRFLSSRCVTSLPPVVAFNHSRLPVFGSVLYLVFAPCYNSSFDVR